MDLTQTTGQIIQEQFISGDELLRNYFILL